MQTLIQYENQDSAIAKLLAKNFRENKTMNYFGSTAKIVSFQIRANNTVRVEMELVA